MYYFRQDPSGRVHLIGVLPFHTFRFPTASTLQPCLKHLQIYGGERFFHSQEVYELCKMLSYTAFQTVRPHTSHGSERSCRHLVFPDGLQSNTLKKAVLTLTLTRPEPAKITLILLENYSRFLFPPLQDAWLKACCESSIKTSVWRCFHIARNELWNAYILSLWSQSQRELNEKVKPLVTGMEKCSANEISQC